MTSSAPAIDPALRLPSSRILPGLLLAGTAAAATMVLGLAFPLLSPVLLAIAAGALARNLGWLPDVLTPGLEVAARRVLRIGIVLLGLQLSLQELGALGWGVPVFAVTVVGVGILSTLALGRALRVGRKQSLLIACGFSICGAAAVAGVERSVGADDDDTVTAVALVVLFGTAMIPLLPWLSGVLGLSSAASGIWAGASIHEVAQVVAAGGIIGGSALAVAVTVKLARVLMLAPVAALLSWRTGDGREGRRPPLVPLFVLGFLLMVAARTWLPIPAEVVDSASLLQRFLLTAAMFALGCGVRLRSLLRRGLRPVILAAGSTAVVGITGLLGALLIG
ncbi:YeiH family protein [Arthrobacter sp. M4]|uniref:YeiH family protein n=1 Tax=Arthrobacter sp. M4 TaxID=218160 RepID=UPI001CDCD8D1|nr:putative sulfate exporter family transporter [Arthrobacter sp. M4]MCA4135607.1 putative sulfate exporter family transporter [Arthrobacter sp. M4]